MQFQDFHNKHLGEICLLVGNGENLLATPPEDYQYPSIGMNTIHKYKGWRPTYYTGVDNRLMREFGKEVSEKYGDIPKFVPTDLKEWQGKNFVFFNHLTPNLKDGWKPETLKDGITYHSSMHVAMQLAYWMGFKIILPIGVSHKPEDGQPHFWGRDEGMPKKVPLNDFFMGYKVLAEGFRDRGISLINISANTYVPDEILPRGNWKDWL